MDTVLTDSLLFLSQDTIADTALQRNFTLGTIIPLDSGGGVFPGEVITSDHPLALAYNAQRFAGIGQPVELFNTDFCLVLLSFSLVLLALLSLYGRRSFVHGFALFSFRMQPEAISSHTSDIMSWPGLLRFVFTVVNIGLFFVISSVITGISQPLSGPGTIRMVLIASGIFTAAILLRHLASMIVAAFSGQRDLFMEYVSVIYSSWFISSSLLFVFAVTALFTPVEKPLFLVWAGAGAIGILFVIRIFRLINIFIKRRVSILYFILYLCALEVLPVLIVIKALGVL